ncbi:MAG: hypothetical protein AB7U59_04030 [Desulfovibrionaceae bacterium]
MDLRLTISGYCCDFALHPVDEATAARVNTLGNGIYKTNSIEWWRADTQNSCGMRFNAVSHVEIVWDGQVLPFDTGHITESATTLRRNPIQGPEHFLCLLGYEDEPCSRTWIWRGVTVFDPTKFGFFVQRWDGILGVRDYLVVEDAFYEGRPADRTDWGESRGYSFRDPLVIDIDSLSEPAETAAESAA